MPAPDQVTIPTTVQAPEGLNVLVVGVPEFPTNVPVPSSGEAAIPDHSLIARV
jgi:hypothetical protein